MPRFEILDGYAFTEVERLVKTARFRFVRVLTQIGFVRVPMARVGISHRGKSVELEMTVD